jgi:hypothetical protein
VIEPPEDVAISDGYCSVAARNMAVRAAFPSCDVTTGSNDVTAAPPPLAAATARVAAAVYAIGSTQSLLEPPTLLEPPARPMLLVPSVLLVSPMLRVPTALASR